MKKGQKMEGKVILVRKIFINKRLILNCWYVELLICWTVDIVKYTKKKTVFTPNASCITISQTQ